jgi:hypothetical protein
VSGFPPEDIRSFLSCCAGEWLALRSRFALEEGEASHRSERGELQVSYLEPEQPEAPGGLLVTPPGGAVRQLTFLAEGRFLSDGQEGTWELWPDASLELTIRGSEGVVRERIWFTKPNLRLRSSVERRADGSPGRASFSSEIRRVSRPAPPAAPIA